MPGIALSSIAGGMIGLLSRSLAMALQKGSRCERARSIHLELAELKGIPYLVRIVFGLRKPKRAHPARLGGDKHGPQSTAIFTL